jgi:hypothetical protein
MAFASALALLGAAGADAAFRAYVSSTGNDIDPCSIQQPCRLLPAALTAVDVGGEIWMLDSANFNTGTVSVTKSVTILAVPGAVGSVVANSADAMSIATAGVKVVLRNAEKAARTSSTGRSPQRWRSTQRSWSKASKVWPGLARAVRIR